MPPPPPLFTLYSFVLHRKRRGAFSLVEIAIVIAILAFVIIPLLGSLIHAHHTNMDARNRTELALISQSFNTILQNLQPHRLNVILDTPAHQPTPEAPGFAHYFSQGGRWLEGDSADAWYRCTIRRSQGPQSRLQTSLIVTISYPAPGFQEEFSYPLSVFHYGTTTQIP